jgi:hypothetical protein
VTEYANAAELVATPTLSEVVRRRADLYQAILGLEQAAARPAAGREGAWTTDLVSALEELEREIDDHIEITERPDGLYAEIVEAAPRLTHRIDLLRDEHPEMRSSAAALRARLAAEDAPGVEETRDEVQRVLGRLVKHRQHGADLLWEAYSLDTGGAE